MSKEIKNYLEKRFDKISNKTKRILNFDTIETQMFVQCLWIKQLYEKKLKERSPYVQNMDNKLV